MAIRYYTPENRFNPSPPTFEQGETVEVWLMGYDGGRWVRGNYRGPHRNEIHNCDGHIVVYDGGRQSWFERDEVRKVQENA